MPTTAQLPTVETRTDDVFDDIHGVAVADPYRWLEDGNDPAVRAWTDAQRVRTAAFDASLPERECLLRAFGELMLVDEVGPAELIAGKLFFTKRAGDQNQPTLRVRNAVDGDDRVLLDLNALDERGLTSLDWWYPSRDGSLIAVGLSQGGDEWSELRLLDAATGEEVGERIDRMRAASVAWFPDNSGFYYTRYPAGDPGAGEDIAYYGRLVHRHVIGTNADADPILFGEGRDATEMPSLVLSDDGRWLVVAADKGWVSTEIHVADMAGGEPTWREVTPEGTARHEPFHMVDGVLYNLTTWNAPDGQIVALDLADPGADWETILTPEPGYVIEQWTIAGDSIVTTELREAIAYVRRYRLDGSLLIEHRLPSVGTTTAMHGTTSSDRVALRFSSFVQPHVTLIFDRSASEGTAVQSVDVPFGFDPDDYTIRQVRYASEDGTSVPMFVIHRSDVQWTGTVPTYLYGYGGFNLTLGSEWYQSWALWLLNGGAIAVPNLRGGAEFGEAWHHDGMLANKQHTFDDMIAAAEWLIANGLTSDEHLGIGGRSNGGLLVGACMTQRPDLFQAVYCGVPLLDMVRYQHFRIAKLWIPEYGDAGDPEQFRWLMAYSPYHHVHERTSYPATLLTLGENDSRVDPMHARKMTAALQAATSTPDERPILLRADVDAGHGSGKPLWMRAEEAAQQWGFLAHFLGLTWDQAVSRRSSNAPKRRTGPSPEPVRT